MSKTVPAPILAAIQSDSVEAFYAVEGLFDGGTVRLWTGYGNKTIEGNTYTGAGELLKIDGLSEVSDLSSKGITITLSGVSSTINSLALQEPYQNRIVRILFGIVGSSDVVEIFNGLADIMPIEDSGETSIITLSVESYLSIIEKNEGRRYTEESQKARFPTDTFFSYVSSMQDEQPVWGRAEA